MNRDNTIYIAMEDEADIRYIYIRKAELRRDETTVKLYIPPQYHARFIALNKICAQRRSEDTELKTQVRFGEDDLIILTKCKGSEEPFRVTYLRDFCGDEHLPEFNTEVKWRVLADRPPRRRPQTHDDPAGRKDEPPRRNLTRQHSIQSTDKEERKKQKRQEMSSSSSSSSSVESSPEGLPVTLQDVEEVEDPLARQNDMDTTL